MSTVNMNASDSRCRCYTVMRGVGARVRRAHQWKVDVTIMVTPASIQTFDHFQQINMRRARPAIADLQVQTQKKITPTHS
jgi:hypothetical protein